MVGTVKRSFLFSFMAIAPGNSSQYFENSFITSHMVPMSIAFVPPVEECALFRARAEVEDDDY